MLRGAGDMSSIGGPIGATAGGAAICVEAPARACCGGARSASGRALTGPSDAAIANAKRRGIVLPRWEYSVTAAAMNYIEKNLAPGEKLVYQTRHHWIVLLGPLFFGLLLGAASVWLLVDSANHSKSAADAATSSAIPASIPPQALEITGAILLAAGLAVVLY